MSEAPEVAADDAAEGSWLDWLPSGAIAVGFIAIAAAVYWLPGYDRIYDHFVLQAQAFLSGRAEIPTPQFQDVLPVLRPDGTPTGYGLLPFPPLPAIVLMPFVALWGLATNERAVSAGLGAITIGLVWWALGRLRISRKTRAATTTFFGFGTVYWYAAQLGDTWFFAHVVAVACLVLAVGVALAGDPDADAAVEALPGPGRLSAAVGDALGDPGSLVDGRQLLAGLLFGLACTARLTIVFGAPFFMLVGSGGSWVRRSVSAGLGAAIPIGLLLAYNDATTGHFMHPGYEYLYQLEANGYPGLHYNPAWGIEDLRYVPQNLRIMLGQLPAFFPNVTPSPVSGGQPLCVDPGAVRSLFDPNCPIAMPVDVGTSLIVTSPAYLLAIPALIGGRTRLVVGAFLAVLAIAFVNLMHFSQGWVQFGYRFSNDFV
ncbi:MAG TPA: hypothetical protein VKR30_12660, partial [Candidatus Limnocylindrales bacterium]|nr:hypothetical protein [Candidatus Limnocylindrales bacterium]